MKNPRSYAAPDESLMLQAEFNTSVGSKFKFTEWWRIAEGEKLSKPFDVGKDLVVGLLRVLEEVSALLYFAGPLINRGCRG
jgi:hypothetical protein